MYHVQVRSADVIIAYDYHIGGLVADRDQGLVDIGLIPVLQGLLVGKPDDHGKLVGVVAGQHGCALAAKNNLRIKGKQGLPHAFDVDLPLLGVFHCDVPDEIRSHILSFFCIDLQSVSQNEG